MTTVSTGFVRFNTGEISPLMSGRVDTEEYASSCAVLKNFIPSVQGPVSRRGGTRFIERVKLENCKTRLYAFQFSSDVSYLLEFGHHYIRFFYDRRPVVDGNDDPVEVATPYDADDLFDLKFAQSGDVVYIAHKKYKLKKLLRYTASGWSIEDAALTDGPYLPENSGEISIAPSALSGDIQLTASASLFSAADVGRCVRLMHTENPTIQWGAAVITAYSSSVSVSARTVDGLPFMKTTATKFWRLGAFNGSLGYPEAVSFFEQRLVLGKGNVVYGSKIGQYDSFSPTAADGTVTAEYGYGYDLSTDQINDVRWLSAGRALAIGTVGADFTLETKASDGTVAQNVRAQRHSTFGSASVAPVKVGNTTLFVQHYGRKLRSFSYDSVSDDYIAKDLTTRAPHISQSGIKEMALQQEPVPVVWCALNNGKLCGLTYEQTEGVCAWARHEISGGFVESVACLPSAQGDRDELFLIVRRIVNGATVRYIEVMEQGLPENADDTKQAFFVDSGLSYEGESRISFGGLDHLEGETVAVLADGAVQNEKIVHNGTITLDSPASVVHVGLPFSSVLETMPLTNCTQERVSETVKKRISGVLVRLYKSLGFAIGTANATEQQSFRRMSDLTDHPPALFSGDKKIAFSVAWKDSTSVRIEQKQPLPLTVLGIFPMIASGKI